MQAELDKLKMASRTQEQKARYAARQKLLYVAKPLSVEQKAERSKSAKQRRAGESPEDKAKRLERAKQRRDSRSPEKVLVDLERKRLSRTPAARASEAELAKLRYAALTPDQKAHKNKIGNLRRTPEQEAKYAEKRRLLRAVTPLTTEQRASRREISRRYEANRTPEQRAERALYDIKYKALNPTSSEQKARNAVGSRNHRAKYAKVDGTHTYADIKALFTSQRGTCPNCQTSLIKRGPGKYHVDHIMPIALGGSNWPSNLQLLCPPCNMSKGAKHPNIWMADNPRKRDVDFIPF